MHIFEREVGGHRYRIAAQSVWDSQQGRCVARQVVLGPAAPLPLADLRATHTVGSRGLGNGSDQAVLRMVVFGVRSWISNSTASATTASFRCRSGTTRRPRRCRWQRNAAR